MCLNIILGQEAKIATEDIVCYKFVEALTAQGTLSCVDRKFDVDYISPYQSAKVKIGDTYQSDIVFNKWSDDMIETGLHSFLRIHSAEEYLSFGESRRIVRCIIPKGATYYKGKFGSEASYVSSQIKYLELI